MEDRLRTSEVNYRALVDRVSYGLYRSMPDGRLLMANPALAEMLGYDSVGELLAAGMEQVYAVPGQRAALMQRYADADRIERVEVDWVRKDNRPIRVQLTGRQVRNSAGDIEAYEMIVEDVTERRTLERQLRHGRTQLVQRRAAARLAGERPHPLDVGEQLLALLLHEHAPEQVAEQANRNLYGLAAAVWTRDIKKAHALSRRLKAGTVWINTYGLMDAALPFGGYKQSGFGRELGMHAIEHYTELKSVWMNL